MSSREKLWTPGPWEVMNSGDIFGPIGGDSGDGCRADDNDGWMIAEVGHYSAFVNNTLVELGQTPRKANIQLISAAPDLVEAGEQLVAEFKSLFNAVPALKNSQAYIDMKKAISKAYGDSQ